MSRKHFFNSIPAISALALAMGAFANAATIQSLSVCTNGAIDLTKSVSCPTGSSDTQQPVMGTDGVTPINQIGGWGGISDEHQSIFKPGALDGSAGYMFFLATRSQGAPDTGLLVLESDVKSPDTKGKWKLQPRTGYGVHQEFLAPVPHDKCPTVPSASEQDPTYDLNYAAPGSVVSDPTNPGNLLMIYEGANTCVGFDKGPGATPQTGGVYITTGVATSTTDGKSWPVYAADFLMPPGLPGQNPALGPEKPLGAFGYDVCMGDLCLPNPPLTANYGRYPVLSPTARALSDIMKSGRTMPMNFAESEPSAFVDDAVRPEYIYVVHDAAPGDPMLLRDPGGPPTMPPFPDGRWSDLAIARAQLNGGTAPLSFYKWVSTSYASPGMGGTETQLLPDGAFKNCGDVSQRRYSGSISYVEETGQYLLLFVCVSPGEPIASGRRGGPLGAAWFWSTSTNLSKAALWHSPQAWSPPQAVAGTWMVFGAGGTFNGWYPSAMSLKKPSGHLSTSSDNAAYVFSMSGIQGATDSRTYMSRQLTIAVQ